MKKYIRPEAELIELSLVDILMTSKEGDNTGTGGEDNESGFVPRNIPQ